jgi:cobalt/nickel transport system permease protein
MVLVVCRFVSILTIGFILLGTTPFLTIIHTMRSLGLPVILADMTLLAYRYLYEIADTLATMQQAMRPAGVWLRQKRLVPA